jgi:hypothetical protein
MTLAKKIGTFGLIGTLSLGGLAGCGKDKPKPEPRAPRVITRAPCFSVDINGTLIDLYCPDKLNPTSEANLTRDGVTYHVVDIDNNASGDHMARIRGTEVYPLSKDGELFAQLGLAYKAALDSMHYRLGDEIQGLGLDAGAQPMGPDSQ